MLLWDLTDCTKLALKIVLSMTMVGMLCLARKELFWAVVTYSLAQFGSCNPCVARCQFVLRRQGTAHILRGVRNAFGIIYVRLAASDALRVIGAVVLGYYSLAVCFSLRFILQLMLGIGAFHGQFVG